jgi:hypothetical protein
MNLIFCAGPYFCTQAFTQARLRGSRVVSGDVKVKCALRQDFVNKVDFGQSKQGVNQLKTLKKNVLSREIWTVKLRYFAAYSWITLYNVSRSAAIRPAPAMS